MKRSRHIIATPPGATIKEQLGERDMSQKEFAARMELSQKHVSKLIHGEVHLTPEVAVRLEMVLGIPAQFWNNLEAIYQEKLVKVKNENEMEADLELVKKLPYNEMVKLGWIPATPNDGERVLYARKFFEVVTLEILQDPLINRIACPRTNAIENVDFALLAWAQEAKLEARRINTKPIDLRAVTDFLPDIRRMTQENPAEFCPKLQEEFAEFGVALVFLPHVGGNFLHGATFYDGDKIVLGITVAGKEADEFWFSLFHELAHILCGHINQPGGTTDEDEREADLFAADTLIPHIEYERFRASHEFSEEALRRFAAYVGIDPGIVAGRLRKEGCIQPGVYKSMNRRYAFQ